jgi:hypothetical protein
MRKIFYTSFERLDDDKIYCDDCLLDQQDREEEEEKVSQ